MLVFYNKCISSWPNCTGVGNTTELTPEQGESVTQLCLEHALTPFFLPSVWTTCPYYTRDGEFNPDRLLVNDTGHFGALADTVFYNSLAWVIKKDSTYSKTVGGSLLEFMPELMSSNYSVLQHRSCRHGSSTQIQR
jgi:hypothetical protein